MMKKQQKKIIIATVAALASGGALLLWRNKKKKEEEAQAQKDLEGDGGLGVLPPPPLTGGGLGGGVTDPVIGGGGTGGVGGGPGINAKLCLGLDANGQEISDLVDPNTECPANVPFTIDDDDAFAQYKADAWSCYQADERDDGTFEIVIQAKTEFSEVCGIDYPDFPFNTLEEAQAYIDDPSSFDGCTDETASNYDAEALFDDGSCEYDALTGCMDETAINYDETATSDDGSCVYGLYSDDIVATVTVECGVTEDELVGLFDQAPIDQVDGIDVYSFEQINSSLPFDCYDEMGSVVDDGSGTTIVSGCTDPTANNFNQDASEDDGSCTYDVATVETTCWYIADSDGNIASAVFSIPEGGTCWEDAPPYYSQDFSTARFGYFNELEDALGAFNVFIQELCTYTPEACESSVTTTCVAIDVTLPRQNPFH